MITKPQPIMRALKISICAFLLLGFFNGNGQHFELIGIDLTKALPIPYNSGTIIEPFATFTFKDSPFRLTGTFGYTNIKIDTVYNNMSYFNKGFYFKAGISTKFARKWEMGVNLIYSSFDELGKTTFKGRYFGDWSVRLNQHQQLYGMEHRTDLWIPLSNRFLFDLQVRLAVIFNKVSEPYFGTYYAPGFGFVQMLTSDSEYKSTAQHLTGGFSMKLVYKL